MGVHLDRLRCRTDRELQVEGIRLIGNQFKVIDNPRLKSVFLHFQIEVRRRGQCVEVVHAAAVAVPDLLFTGRWIG